METKVRKWGNSLAVRLPKTVTRALKWREGTSVKIRSTDQEIIVQVSKKKETLQDLLKGINKKNRPRLVDFGPDVGKEIID